MANGVEKWIETLVSAEKTCLVQDGRRKIHFTFADKTEMTEEYNVQTGELIGKFVTLRFNLSLLKPFV